MFKNTDELPKDLITVTDARKIVQCSPFKMAGLLRDGTLRSYSDPLDKRIKLVSKAEVRALIVKKAKAA